MKKGGPGRPPFRHVGVVESFADQAFFFSGMGRMAAFSPLAAAQCAQVAPTFPAPMMLIFARRMDMCDVPFVC